MFIHYVYTSMAESELEQYSAKWKHISRNRYELLITI